MFETKVDITNNVFHSSPPSVRNSIFKNGILPKIGESYKLRWSGKNLKKAVFVSCFKYYSTFDDDIWEIDIQKCKLNAFKDDGAPDGCYVCFHRIPPDAIKLIYKGTGESC